MTHAPQELEYYIRTTTREDLATVMSINETTLPENYPLFFYENIMQKYPNSFLVSGIQDSSMVTGERLLGYIMWRIERGISEFGIKIVKKGHLVSLAVLKDYRRRGVASALLEKGMRQIAGYGAQEFVLEVRISNFAAIKLYQEHFQFEKKKIIPEYYRDGENAYYMAYRDQ